MSKENKALKGFKNPGVIVGLIFLGIIILVSALLFWNYINNKDYDDSVYKPIPIAEENVVPSSRDIIINSYNDNKATFEKVFEFMTNTNTTYKVNATIDNGVKSLKITPEITDSQIKGMLEQIINDLGYKSVFNAFSKSPDDMAVWILFDGKEGSYQRGLVYFKNIESKNNYVTYNNEKWEFKELAPNTYFYYNQFDKVKHQDVFRNIAWNSLSAEQKAIITTKKDQAIIKIVKVYDSKTDKTNDAISLNYSTNKPGYGNNIKVYIDGKTRQVIKTTSSIIEEMFGI